MESVRVRGCVVEVPRSSGASRGQADASRRQNGPRKAVHGGTTPRVPPEGGKPITVRLSRKSCPVPVVRHGGRWEKGSSGREAANPSAGDCGVEDQVGRTDSFH